MPPNPDTSSADKTKMSESKCNNDLAVVQLSDVPRRDSIQSNASAKSRISQGTRAPGPPIFEPPDGGYGWMVVVGAILSGALIPSLFMCFGVFMNAFTIVFPNTSKSSAAWIPSIMSSLMNCMGPITSALVNLYSARLVSIIGGCVISTGLILSYFTNSIQALYFTYGILGGIGAGLAIAPGLYLISTYFKKRRGLATGICMAGSSVGQIVIPYVIQFLLDKYDYRGCILILGGLTLNVCVAGALYRPLQIAPKVPKTTKRERTVSQSSRTSSLTFIPDEGFCMCDNGNYKAMSKKNAQKSKDSKKKKLKKSKNNNRNNKKSQGGASKTEIQAILIENTWNSIKQNDSQAPLRSRSRTLSLDSSRILPDIPEEHEDDADTEHGQPTVTSKPTLALESKNEPDTEDNINGTVNNNGTGDTNGTNNNNGTSTVNSTNNTNGTNTSNGTNNTNDTSTTNNSSVSDTPYDTPVPNNNADVWRLREDFKTTDSVSLSVSCADSDDDYANEQCESLRPKLEVVTLHQCYGSMASIASLGPSVDERRTAAKTSILENISKFLSLRFFKESIFYIIAASFTFLVVVLTSYTMFIPTYGTSINLSKDQSAGLISIIAVASMFGRLLLPTISDYVKVKRKHIYLTSCLVTSGSIILTIFANSYEMLLVSLVFFGFSTGGSVSLSISVSLDYIALDKFAALFGLVQLVTGMTVLFANPVFGLLMDATKSYTLTFCILCVAATLSGLVLYLDRFSNYESVAPPGKYKTKSKK